MSFLSLIIIVVLLWLITWLFKTTLNPSHKNVHGQLRKMILAIPEFSNKELVSLNLLGGSNYSKDEYERIRNIVLDNGFDGIEQETYSDKLDNILVYKISFAPNESYMALVLKQNSSELPEIKELFRLV